MKTRYSLVVLAIGLGLALVLLWAMGGQTVSSVMASNIAMAAIGHGNMQVAAGAEAYRFVGMWPMWPPEPEYPFDTPGRIPTKQR